MESCDSVELRRQAETSEQIPGPSLRAKRSNPGAAVRPSGLLAPRMLWPLDCFVARAPRNDGWVAADPIDSVVIGRRLRRGPIDRVKQVTRRKRLQQISDAACPQRLPAHHLTIEGGHEDDRNRRTGSLESPPQFNSRHAAEVDIDEQAVEGSSDSAIQELLRRCKALGFKTMRVQHVLGGSEEARIIVHHRYGLSPFQLGHSASAS